jgi:hypothetical protein
VIEGRFQLEKKVLRIDNAVRLLAYPLVHALWPSYAGRGIANLTQLQAELLDDAFLSGASLPDAVANGRPELMVCVTDLANSSLIGLTRKGFLVVGIDPAVQRLSIVSPKGGYSDFSWFYSFGDPRATAFPLSRAIAASGAYPIVFPPMTNRLGMALVDGGVGDNYGIVLLDTAQYFAADKHSQKVSIYSKFDLDQWDVQLILISDGSQLKPRVLADTFADRLARTLDVVYSMSGGPGMLRERPILPFTNGKTAPRAEMLLLSPLAVAKDPSKMPSSVVRETAKRESGRSVADLDFDSDPFVPDPYLSDQGKPKVNFFNVPKDDLLAMALVMPALTRSTAEQLIKSLSQENALNDGGLKYGEGEKAEADGKALWELYQDELDRVLRCYINTGTIRDRFEPGEALAIYQLGRYVAILNHRFIRRELEKVRPLAAEPYLIYAATTANLSLMGSQPPAKLDDVFELLDKARKAGDLALDEFGSSSFWSGLESRKLSQLLQRQDFKDWLERAYGEGAYNMLFKPSRKRSP